ncbi:MAG: methionyl-tRNA formyltransferase [Sphingomonadaceae bacterium]|nr:methionyl-tRNA formyltransferase [Sphingomonadaceae bacterium]
MRIVFMGTPDFAVPSLDALVAAGYAVIAAYTQPPRRAGRGKALSRSPVQRRAETLGIAVRHPASLRNAEAQADFAALDADIAVVAAYGLILPQAILDAPRHGCINVHASLLPRWRGAAPIQRAILAGDAVTGVTIMAMEAGLDTGPMLAKAETAVGAKTAGSLTAELAAMGAALLVRVLEDLSSWLPSPQPEHGVTYAHKIEKAETRLDFSREADELVRKVRAFAPAPGAWFEANGERIRILEAGSIHCLRAPPKPGIGRVVSDSLLISCGRDWLDPLLVQRAGREPMRPADFLRGFPIPKDTILT